MPRLGQLIRRSCVPALAAALLLTATACQGGGVATTAGEGSTDSGAGSGAGAAKAAAQQLVAQFSKTQGPIAVKALGAPPKPGMTVGLLACEFPACLQTVEGAKAAATAIGWKTKVLTTQLTPEAYAEGWGRMMADPPNAIIFNGVLPNAVVKNYQDQAKNAGIPLVAIASSDEPSDLVPASTASSAQLTESGRLMGAAIAADAETAPEVLFVWDPRQVAIFGPVKDAIEKQVNAVGGKLKTVDVQSTEIGKSVPSSVASAVQANPNAKYVAFAIADFTAGVPEALATLGTDVKLITRSPGEGNLKNIQSGAEWVGVAEESTAAGWAAMDSLLRIQAKQEFDADPVGWHQILSADNIDKTNPASSLNTPGIPDSYLKAWGVK